jgi:hypothetical protein
MPRSEEVSEVSYYRGALQAGISLARHGGLGRRVSMAIRKALFAVPPMAPEAAS